MNVDNIIPDPKDISRSIKLSKNGSTPSAGKAASMAKLIKDRDKLVRRAKAVATVWGTRDYDSGNAWDPFALALEKMGFTYTEITKISKYDAVEAGIADPIELLGLEDLL